ncbi:hypothetical protein [Acinetobacter larvae]|uniref:Lipoprotein n=1 Tax=Acinetobacter larvae TaxID=1789224 RepID=A0A1B2LYQ7_9GAMM|nr:hypothetical protein [Acinetobacter larvae]AOA58019.1 hypothetical protein BFG52_06405 [Acinetobacter larvae]
MISIQIKISLVKFATLSLSLSLLSACQQHPYNVETSNTWQQQQLYRLTPRKTSLATVQQRCQQTFHNPCHQHVFASIDLNNGPALYGVDLQAHGYHSMVYSPLPHAPNQNSNSYQRVALWFFDVSGRLQQIMIQQHKAE